MPARSLVEDITIEGQLIPPATRVDENMAGTEFSVEGETNQVVVRYPKC